MPTRDDIKTAELAVRALQKLCRNLGGRLVRKTDRKWWAKVDRENETKRDTDVASSPFDRRLAINWDKKIIYFRNSLSWPGIIHEMAHVFACRERPLYSNELDFLGWEWRVAVKLGVSRRKWFDFMRGYELGELGSEAVGNGLRFEHMAAANRSRILGAAIRRARRYGNLDAQKNPVAVR